MKITLNEIIAAIIGAFLFFMISKSYWLFIKKIQNLTKILAHYVSISIIILLITAILHVINLIYSPVTTRNIFFELINFYGGLVFVIITGYFAFRQLQLYRFDKLLEDARTQLRIGNYLRAEKLYIETYKINSLDITVIEELAELSLRNQNQKMFDETMEMYDSPKVILEDQERIVPLYLRVAQSLLKQEIGDAKTRLKALIKYSEEHSRALLRFNWSFKELQDSDIYRSISGESVEIFKKMILYLTKKMGLNIFPFRSSTDSESLTDYASVWELTFSQSKLDKILKLARRVKRLYGRKGQIRVNILLPENKGGQEIPEENIDEYLRRLNIL